MQLRDIDLSDPELFAGGDPHASFRVLRQQAPVYRHPQSRGPGFWAITRYADVVSVSSDPVTFSSAGGTTTYVEDDALKGAMLVVTDPPHHRRLRSIVNRGFTPRSISRLEPFVRSVVSDIVDGIAPRGECEFVGEVAARLPFNVICELLGVPASDRPQLFETLNPMLGGDPLVPGEPPLDVGSYFVRLASERKLEPREDLISAVVGAEVGGDRIEPNDMLALCVLLFVAGSETTMNAISGGMLAFVENPVQRERLEADTSLWPAAVDEILRFASPVLVSMVRTATRDTEIRGTPIAKGDKVTLWYPSANRDEEVFALPDHFDVGRSPNEHVAFGFGEHFCLGASLARLEIRVMFEELLSRLRDVQLAGQIARLRSRIFYGLERFPVRFAVR